MLTDALVGLFPGQGALVPFEGGSLFRSVMAEIDGVAERVLGKDVSSQVFGPTAVPDDLLQLAVFSVSVGTYELLRARDVRLGLLLGHGMGEVAALVGGGALTIAQGAEMHCHRIAATAGTPGGGMLSLGCDEDRAEQILDLCREPGVVLAMVDGPSQVVVSGPSPGLRRIEAVADALGLTVTRLNAPAPFHNPLMAGVRTELVKRLSALHQGPLRTPVYSPVLGRFYRDDDDLGGVLGLHLVTQVRFDKAITRLHEAGARIFMEIGAGGTLTELVTNAHPEALILPAFSDRPPDDQEPRFVPRPRRDPAPTREEVMAKVRAIYAEALEYPEEVFTADAHLEADLGVDSVRRIELLDLIHRHFALEPSRADSLRIAGYETVGAVVALVTASLEAAGGAAT